MARKRHHPNPDLFIHSYGQTCSIQVNREGRLAALAKGVEGVTQYYEPCWLFRNHISVSHPEVEGIDFDYLLRGLLCGTWEDHERFVELCDRIGVTHEAQTHWVPLLHGRDVVFRREPTEDDPRKQIRTFNLEEFARVRIDLPTEVVLRETLLAPYGETFRLIQRATSDDEIRELEEAIIREEYTPKVFELIAAAARACHVG